MNNPEITAMSKNLKKKKWSVHSKYMIHHRCIIGTCTGMTPIVWCDVTQPTSRQILLNAVLLTEAFYVYNPIKYQHILIVITHIYVLIYYVSCILRIFL